MEKYVLTIKRGDEWLTPYLEYFESVKDAKRIIKRAISKLKLGNPHKLHEISDRRKTKNYEDYIIGKYTFRINTIRSFIPEKSPSPSEKDENCCVCWDSVPKKKAMKCNHHLCDDCVVSLNKNECPMCRKELQIGGIVTKKILDIVKKNEEEYNKEMSEERNREDAAMARRLQEEERQRFINHF